MKVVVLLSAAGGGDRQPAISLAVALGEQGHGATFVCDSATSALVAGTGIPTVIHGVEQVGFISRWITQLEEVDHPPNPFLTLGGPDP